MAGKFAEKMKYAGQKVLDELANTIGTSVDLGCLIVGSPLIIAGGAAAYFATGSLDAVPAGELAAIPFVTRGVDYWFKSDLRAAKKAEEKKARESVSCEKSYDTAQ